MENSVENPEKNGQKPLSLGPPSYLVHKSGKWGTSEKDRMYKLKLAIQPGVAALTPGAVYQTNIT